MILAVPVGAVAPLHTRLRLVNSEWGGLENLSSEICALFAVWQEFLHFEEFTIAYCNTHTDTRAHTHTDTRAHTHTGYFKAVCTNFNGRQGTPRQTFFPLDLTNIYLFIVNGK